MLQRLILLLGVLFTAGCGRGPALMDKIRVHSEHEDINAQYLLNENPELVSYRDRQGRTPLHEAADSCNLTIAIILVRKGAEVNAVDELGNTPLHYAAKPRLIEDMEAKKGSSGFDFLLMRRYYTDQSGIISLLIKSDADQKIKNKDGKTWTDLAGFPWAFPQPPSKPGAKTMNPR